MVFRETETTIAEEEGEELPVTILSISHRNLVKTPPPNTAHIVMVFVKTEISIVGEEGLLVVTTNRTTLIIAGEVGGIASSNNQMFHQDLLNLVNSNKGVGGRISGTERILASIVGIKNKGRTIEALGGMGGEDIEEVGEMGDITVQGINIDMTGRVQEATGQGEGKQRPITVHTQVQGLAPTPSIVHLSQKTLHLVEMHTEKGKRIHYQTGPNRPHITRMRIETMWAGLKVKCTVVRTAIPKVTATINAQTANSQKTTRAGEAGTQITTGLMDKLGKSLYLQATEILVKILVGRVRNTIMTTEGEDNPQDSASGKRIRIEADTTTSTNKVIRGHCYQILTRMVLTTIIRSGSRNVKHMHLLITRSCIHFLFLEFFFLSVIALL